MLSLQRVVDGGSANNMTTVIVDALKARGGLTCQEIADKVICFGADGANVFQGFTNWSHLAAKRFSCFLALWTTLHVTQGGVGPSDSVQDGGSI